MRQVAAVMGLTIVFGLAGPAFAEPDPEAGQPRRSLSAVIGLGTPVGSLGLEGSYRIRPDLEISAGVGLGLSVGFHDSPLAPVQWSVMPRYRVGNAHDALTLGLGMSGGNYAYTLTSLCGSQEELVECNTNDARYTLWANAEIGGEHVGPTGFMVRYFVGYGHILAQGAHHCTYFNQPSDTCGGVPGNTLPYADIPYFGVALGQAF